MTDPKRWSEAELLTLAQRGVGRVDRDGMRGATLVTIEEVAAMAALLALLGVRAIYPDTYQPASIITYTEGPKT